VRELLARTTLGETAGRPSNETVTLRYLLDRYCKESATFLDNSKPTRDDGETRVKVLCAYFGEECDVRELREDDVVAYTRWRLKGGVKYGVDRKTGRPKLTRRSRSFRRSRPEAALRRAEVGNVRESGEGKAPSRSSPVARRASSA